MCGLAGFYESFPQTDASGLCKLVRRMADTIRHRGPDNAGEWAEARSGIAFGFRRLAILDLTPGGHQPMESASGRYVIAFNGEVYNYRLLRSELEAAGLAPVFRGGSDTEVMLACVEAWGLDAAVRKFGGMFAFALWDRRERVLHLVRDRVGVKPLYYGRCGTTFLFGSELKALRAHPAFDAPVDRDALALYLQFGYVPAPHSIYRGIRKLAPGTILSLPAEAKEIPAPVMYWSARNAAADGIAHPFSGSEQEAQEQLNVLLRDAIGLRMIADVPVGVFLSGGVDSSLIAALMQAQSSRPVKSFSIGFRESGHNEAHHAERVACHLKTDHTELYVTPQEAMSVIPALPTCYDEPFADASQIPYYLVCQLARKQVTVALSGDGGDELFGGYTRYFAGSKLWNRMRRVPRPLRQMAALGLMAVPPPLWDTLGRNALATPGDKIGKMAKVLSERNADGVYRGLVSHWNAAHDLVIGAQKTVFGQDNLSRLAAAGVSESEGAGRDSANFTERMMYFDLMTYLPDDILVKGDRASMSVALEAREPLLDHRLVEFAWKLPLSMKIQQGQGKVLLRKVLYEYVPQEMIERPKMGFGVPIDSWLRGPLRDWAEDLLSPARLNAEGYLDPAPIRKKWAEHLSGRRNWQYHIWDILMFQAWLATAH